MTRIKTAALAIATSLATGIAIAGHHEKGNHMKLAAQPGQVRDSGITENMRASGIACWPFTVRVTASHC